MTTPTPDLADPTTADDLAEPTTGGDDHRWHLCRAPFTHGICGCEVNPLSDRRGHPGGDGCRHCRRIADLWLRTGIWEGHGPPPSVYETLELDVVLE